MMVNTFWRGDTTKVILLQVLVANSLLHFSSVTGDAAKCNTKSTIPEVKIFSSPPNRTQPIAAAINLTCEAWPKHQDVSYPRRWIKYIQWYDTHGRQIGDKCLNTQSVKSLKCPLILKNLTIENFGNYTCEAENDYTEYCTRKSVEILHKENLSPIDTTKAPHLLFPEVVENPKNQSAFIGSNVTFNCTTMGLPTPAISWMKNNDSYAVTSNVRAMVVPENNKSSTSNHSQLIITKVKIEDSGKYQCVASNSAGERKSSAAFLYIKEFENSSPPDTTKAPHLLFPEVVENPKNQSAFIGSNVTFNCTATGLPTPAISWMKNNDSYAVTSNVRARVVPENKNNHSQLIITEVKIEDNGKYQCIARNSDGERTSSAAFLYILEFKTSQESEKEIWSTSPQISFSTLSYAIIATFVGVFIGGICVGFWLRTTRRRGEITFNPANDCEEGKNEFKQIE